MKVVFSRAALAELDEILAYLAFHSPKGAERVESRIRQVIQVIAEQPDGSQVVARRRSVRRAPLVNFPYVIYYRATETEVTILRIRHGARRPIWNR
jgi:plasmid stabilization system protein ParE